MLVREDESERDETDGDEGVELSGKGFPVNGLGSTAIVDVA
jgi:hypothetical protein